MEKEIEILVHVAAPSCAKDDQKYRRQATALLNFERGRRITRVASSPGFAQLDTLVAASGHEIGEDRNLPAQPHSDDRVEIIDAIQVAVVHEDSSKITTPRLPSSSTVSGKHDDVFVGDSSSPCPGVGKARPLKPVETEETVISSSTISPGQHEPEPIVALESLSRKRKHDVVEGNSITSLRTPGGPSSRILSSNPEIQVKTSSSKTSHVSETPYPPGSAALVASPSLRVLSSVQPSRDSRRPRTAPSVETTSSLLISSRPGLRRSLSTTASAESLLSVVPDSQLPTSTAPERATRTENLSNHYLQETTSREPSNKRIRIETSSQQSNSTQLGNSSSHPISISSDELPLRGSQHSDRDDGSKFPSPLVPPSPTMRPSSSPQDANEPEPRLSQSLDDPFNEINSLPYSSTAPPPPPGTSFNPTNISASLSTIEGQLPLAIYFKPVSQSRELAPLERGYWEVTIPISGITRPITTNEPTTAGDPREPGTPCTPQEFIKFFSFMDRMILANNFGWDIWANRETAVYGADGQLWDAESVRRETYRLFCPGGMAGHLWMALYVGGRRIIKGMGAVWKDAEEKVVIQMCVGWEK